MLVGAGQLSHKVAPEEALEPVDMMAEAARRAAAQPPGQPSGQAARPTETARS